MYSTSWNALIALRANKPQSKLLPEQHEAWPSCQRVTVLLDLLTAGKRRRVWTKTRGNVRNLPESAWILPWKPYAHLSSLTSSHARPNENETRRVSQDVIVCRYSPLKCIVMKVNHPEAVQEGSILEEERQCLRLRAQVFRPPHSRRSVPVKTPDDPHSKTPLHSISTRAGRYGHRIITINFKLVFKFIS